MELRALKSDCVYLPGISKPAAEVWAQRNREKIENILVLKMLEEQNRADGEQNPDGEIVLPRARLFVTPAAEATDHE